MTSETLSTGGSKRALVIVLAVIAVIALILGILWMSGSAPGFLNSGSHVHAKHGGHIFRGIAGIVVAVVCGVGAWWTNKK